MIEVIHSALRYNSLQTKAGLPNIIKVSLSLPEFTPPDDLLGQGRRQLVLDTPSVQAQGPLGHGPHG